jgi:hypothetical protein
MLVLKSESKRLSLQPKPNEFIEEVENANKKSKVFKTNLSKILHLIKTQPSEFSRLELKRPAPLTATLWKGGTKLLTLNNDDIYFHETNAMVDKIKTFLEDKNV